MLLNKKEKEKLVIKLANEGKTTRQIAKDVWISLRTIGKILNKVTGDDKEEEKEKLESKSEYAQAFKMFKDGRPLEDVAIDLDLDTETVIYYYYDYLKLVNMQRLVTIYKELEYDLPLFLHLYRRIKKEGLNKEDITELLRTNHLLSDLYKRIDFYNNHIKNMMIRKAQLEHEIL